MICAREVWCNDKKTNKIIILFFSLVFHFLFNITPAKHSLFLNHPSSFSITHLSIPILLHPLSPSQPLSRSLNLPYPPYLNLSLSPSLLLASLLPPLPTPPSLPPSSLHVPSLPLSPFSYPTLPLSLLPFLFAALLPPLPFLFTALLPPLPPLPIPRKYSISLSISSHMFRTCGRGGKVPGILSDGHTLVFCFFRRMEREGVVLLTHMGVVS